MNSDTQLLNEHNKQEFPPMHTTEHIINRAMINIFGCKRAFSAHIERKKSKLDFTLLQCPTEQQMAFLERHVNEVIARNMPVTIEFISQQQAKNRFDLTRLPDNASETVRIVRVGDYDECLCIGSHVDNTSEIGSFKLLNFDWNEEKSTLRIRFKLIR
jgi:Ser-tRNA(Ala) deacylase AlaX